MRRFLPRAERLAGKKGAPASIPSLAGSHRAGYWREFWTTHIRLGYAVLAGESFAALLYFLLTPSGSHRPLLIAIACLSLAIAIGVGAFASRIAARSWRIQLIFLSTVLSGIVLTLCVHLDGGINSPLVYLTVLPVMSAALALPESQVTICGLAAAAEIVIVVSITDPRRASPASKLLILFAFVLGTIVLSVVSARGRARLQAKETVTLDELSRLAETDSADRLSQLSRLLLPARQRSGPLPAVWPLIEHDDGRR